MQYSGTSVIRHLDNPEHLYNPTQNVGLNGGYIEISPE